MVIPLFRAAQIFLLVLGYVLLGATFTQADSELQKFEATLPLRAKLGFIRYRNCAFSLAKWRTAGYVTDPLARFRTFRDAETTIAKDCVMDLLKAETGLAETGIVGPESAKTIEQYRVLMLAEARFLFEGKSIPGYRGDPLGGMVEEIFECERRIKTAMDAYDLCVTDTMAGLVPYSNDASDVLTDAILGLCESKRHNIVRDTAPCVGGEAKAEVLASKTRDSRRTYTLSAVVKYRAEQRRRQSVPGQAPLAPTGPH